VSDRMKCKDTASQAASPKAAPEAVIGKRSRGGHLKKRLIMAVIAVSVVGMLVLNFLPGDRKRKSANEGDTVYANDTMPQDVREMAMKLPEVKITPAASAPQPAFGRTSGIKDPFTGYPTGQSERSPSARTTGTEAASGAGKDYSGMAATDARLEEERAARRAPMEVSTKLTAGLIVSASKQTASTNALEVPQTPVVVASGLTQYPVQGAVVSGVVPQVTYTPGEIYRDLNDQKTKQEFSVSKAESAASNVAKPADPELLPFTIFAGTIIPAALETGINTDLPGDVLATVTENVYDSVSGKNLLIPQGSKLLAKYSSNISFGQNRVQVAWQRLVRPDGVSLQMGNMNGVDPQGMSGYAGSVDEHWWEYAKGIGLMLLFSIIDGQIQYSMKEANTQGATDVANSLTAGLDQVGSQYTSNVMNIQPTITVKQGSKVQVFVNADLIMPLANQKAVSKKYTIPKEEGGTQ